MGRRFLPFIILFCTINYVPVHPLLFPSRINSYLTKSLYLKERAVDPLDYVKTADTDRDSSIPLSNVAAGGSGSPIVSLEQDELAFSEESNRFNLESDILAQMPFEVYLSFRDFCRNFVSRISIMAVIIHMMMLVPTIKYFSTSRTGAIPFLYLGPLVFILPYLALFLWESNILRIPLIDAKVAQFIEFLQRKAQKQLLSSPLDIKEFESSQKEARIKQIYLQIMTSVDVESLAIEVLAVKDTQAPSGASSSSTSISSIQSNRSRIDIQFGEEKASISSRISGSDGSISSAVQSLLVQAELQGNSKEEILEKLKQLQSELTAK